MNWNIQKTLLQALHNRKEKLNKSRIDERWGLLPAQTQIIIDEYMKECDDAINWVKEHSESPNELFDNKVIDIINFIQDVSKTSLRTYQKELITKLADNDKVKVNWTRQSGKNHVLLHYIAYLSIFDKCNILIKGRNTKHDNDMLSEMKRIVATFNPTYFGPSCIHSVSTPTSIIVTDPDIYRSRRNNSTRNIVLLNEYDYNKCDKVSVGSLFLDDVICVSRELKDPFFVEHRSHWYDVPGRDERFKRSMIANIGQDSWNREFEVD
tara:strand:+ start:314 stop:1111 length:798 start_codon:yes stop_codon:yes gene_type:complete